MKTLEECNVRIAFLRGRINRYEADVERAKTSVVIPPRAIALVQGLIERDKGELFQTEELVKVLRKKKVE